MTGLTDRTTGYRGRLTSGVYYKYNAYKNGCKQTDAQTLLNGERFHKVSVTHPLCHLFAKISQAGIPLKQQNV